MNKIFLLFRIAVFSLAVFLLLRPVKKVYTTSTSPEVAVLIDGYRSMRNMETSVYEKIYSKVASRFVADKNVKSNFYVFSDSANNIIPGDIKQYKPVGDITDIFGGMDKIKTDYLGRRLDAVVLVSDGNQNVEGSAEDMIAEYSGLNVPVHTIHPSPPPASRNIAVNSVVFPDIIFRNTISTLTAVIDATGYAGKSVDVIFKIAGKVITTKSVDITGDGPAEAQFLFRHDFTGNIQGSIEVPVYKGERSSRDNKLSFMLQVEPEKIRILYLCGQPSFNYSFLRATLKNEPNVELVTFVILRNPENIVTVSDNELSLIPFPVDEIFTKELFNFDILILDNFNYARFFVNQQYLTNIRNFVSSDGKSLLVVSGAIPLSVYKNTPLDELLPVDPSGEIKTEKFTLNAVNAEHPVMKLTDVPADNLEEWKKMPVLEGYNACALKKKSVLLASVRAGDFPIVSLAEKNKGRVMCVTTSSLWRVALGGSAAYNYVKFWRQSVRWLSNASSLKQVAVFAKTNYNIGDTARMSVKVQDEYSRPVNDAVVEGVISLPGGKKDYVIIPPAIADGQYEIKYNLASAGNCKVFVSVRRGRKMLGSDELSFSVSDYDRESASFNVNDRLLKRISAGTGGKSFILSSFKYDDLGIEPRQLRNEVLYEINIWEHPAFYLILILILFAEWWYRRRKGKF